MCWRFRIQCCKEGVHRSPIAGIAGQAEEGCQSIVLAGGYEDDTDDGVEFIYTGSGGRDLSGNKRTAEQSMDQVSCGCLKGILSVSGVVGYSTVF